MYHANLNVNLIIENVNEIVSGITINVSLSAEIQKNILHVKKVISGILLC